MLERAKKTLRRARYELHHAKDDEDYRQAAEKAWRAAREAVYAVIQVVEQKPRGTLKARHVAAFEAKHLGRESLTDKYSRALEELHGDIFYDGNIPTEEMLEREMDSVGKLLSDAEDAISFLRSRRRK